METFHVTIQSPLEDLHDAGLLDTQATLARFQRVDWIQWASEASEPLPNTTPEAFYFFEAKRPGEKHREPLLCISGQYQTSKDIERNGPLCTLHYFFLEKTISKGFLGFGAGKEIIELSDRTMRDCTVEFAQQCLEAFMRGDLALLDQQIKHNDFEDSN
jgi:hypothetical protein